MNGTKIILVVILAVTIALAFMNTYHVTEAASVGSLFWNAREAYLFLNVGRLGYRLRYVEYPFEVLKESLGGGPTPADRKYLVVAFHITPEALQRYVDNISLDLYTPIDGVIYANHEGALWRWGGTHFEPATQQEQQKIGGIGGLSALDVTNVNGWSKRSSVLQGLQDVNRFSFEVGGEPTSLVVSGLRAGNLSLDLLRPGKAPEEIWHLDGRTRKVSRAEYRQLFRK